MSSAPIPVALMALSAVVSATLALWLWEHRRNDRTVRLFVYVMIAVAEWATMAALELGLGDPGAKQLFAQFSYLGSTSVAPLWLLFAVRYCGFDRVVTPKRVAALFVIPVVVTILVFTNGLHDWIWTSVKVDEIAGILVFGRGWAWWLFISYSYLLLIAGTGLLISALVTAKPYWRRQTATIVIAGLVPWAGSFLYVGGRSPWLGTHLAPVLLTVGGLTVTWGLIRYGLLEVTPAARNAILDAMADACVVVDRKGRLVEANRAALLLLGADESDVGRPASEVCKSRPSISQILSDVNSFDGCEGKQTIAVNLSGDDPPRFMSVTRSPMRALRGEEQACVFLFHDITDVVKADEERTRLGEQNIRLLEEARKRAEEAETLRHAAAAVAASLRLDQAVDRILQEIARVVPHYSGLVWLIQGESLMAVGSQGRNVSAELAQSFSDGYLSMSMVDLNSRLREVVEQRRPVLIPAWGRGTGQELRKVSTSTSMNPTVNPGAFTAWLGVPLLVGDELVGVLELATADPAGFDSDQVRMVVALADHVALALQNARLYEEAKRLATTDPLTGVFNRRHFLEVGQREFERARRYPPKSLSAFMLDIDNFKAINDGFGHAAGDRVLQAVADLCREQLRCVDIFARMGGEEFAALLPETDVLGAKYTAVRLWQSIRNLSLPSLPRFTASFGVAEITPECTDLDMLLIWCDRALYMAKQQGRDRVLVYSCSLGC